VRDQWVRVIATYPGQGQNFASGYCANHGQFTAVTCQLANRPCPSEAATPKPTEPVPMPVRQPRARCGIRPHVTYDAEDAADQFRFEWHRIEDQMSMLLAIPMASSLLMPRLRSVLSIFKWPSNVARTKITIPAVDQHS